MNVSRKSSILPIVYGDFEIEDAYPLLNEVLYKKWPSDAAKHGEFINEAANAVLDLLKSG